LKPEVAFGQVLRELRLAIGLSQEKLAQEAEMERNYVSLLELGRNSASIDKIFKLAKALGVPASEILLLAEKKIAGRRLPKSSVSEQ
jgi:transcriptional regulator with XRE-family HTH domain